MRIKKHTVPDQKSVTYGIPAEEIALLCGVSLRTACRWKSGSVAMDTASKLILAGDLGCFAPEWSGWVVNGNQLISPEGWKITVNDVLATPLMRTQIALYQAESRRLKADLASALANRLDEQPTPESWDIQILTG